jgi:LytS/YehU family sensor histidine kinase
MTPIILLSASNDITEVALWTMLPFTVAFIFIVFVFYRNRREAQLKQQEAELKQHIAEMEMKALRAQMNPHFIFNCMNSIYFFIRQNDGIKAGQYLVKFSNLMRMVLENSVYQSVALKNDLEVLDLYIQMEQMRMNYRFDYTIETDPLVNNERVLVPPLILQPFVENSIWHGLNGKKTQGCLQVKIMRDNDMLKCVVEDDGNEIAQPKEERLAEGIIKKKSLGMGLTNERLELLNRSKKSKAHFSLSDKRSEQNEYLGKRMVLFLPYEETAETEPAK